MTKFDCILLGMTIGVVLSVLGLVFGSLYMMYDEKKEKRDETD